MSVMQTDLGTIKLANRGKVRDIYDLGDQLLFIATDRLSAFDWVLPDAIPDRGKILTSMSVFWFDYLKDIVDNHLVTADIDRYPEELKQYRDQLEGRSMIVRKAKRIDIECIARGYIIGSGYKDYKKLVSENGKVNLHGNILPDDLKLADKLPQPIFTPSTKAESGHDENISIARMEELVGAELTAKLGKLTIDLYSKAADYALTKGIIIADTKFEFGFIDDKIIIIDEILSPDSSRFWPAETYEPGKNPESYDKQFVRDYLSNSDWDKNSEPPSLPEDIIENTLAKYKEAHRKLTGRDL